MSVHYEKIGEKKYKLIWSSGSRENRKRKCKTIEINGNNKEIERNLLRACLDFDEDMENKEKGFDLYSYDDKTMEILFDVWLENKKTSLKPKTYVFYRSIIDTRLIPKFGKIKAKNMTALRVKNYFTELLTTNSKMDGSGPLSKNSIKRIYSTLNACVNDCFNDQLISQNFMLTVKPPRVDKYIVDIYTPEESQELIRKVIETEDIQFITLVLIAISTGARRGEIVALTWEDIKKTSKGIYAINIVRAISVVADPGGKGPVRTVGDPKSGARSVGLPEIVVYFLNKLYQSEKRKFDLLASKWEGHEDLDKNFIFTNQYGKGIQPDSISQKWNRFIKNTDLKKIRFHDLRHTAASYFIDGGMTVKEVQYILGHVEASTTLDTYSHLLFPIEEKGLETIEKTLFDNKLTGKLLKENKNVPPNVPLLIEKTD